MSSEFEYNLGATAQAVAPTEPDALLDQTLWRQMLDADSLSAFAGSWLTLQCHLIDGVRLGVVVLGPADSGPYAPAAFWPAGRGGTLGLTSATELALQERRGVLRELHPGTAGRHGACHLACPLLFEGRLYGVVAVELTVRPEPALRAAMRRLQWGMAWIEGRIRREAETPRTGHQENPRPARLLELMAACLEGQTFRAAATNLATELALGLRCERVSVGFLKGRHVEVMAVSHSAHFETRSELADAIGLAMDEALDQKATLVYPPEREDSAILLRQHAELSEAHRNAAVCTIPLSQAGAVLGALTLERPKDAPFDRDAIEFLEVAAAALGPLLDLKRREERPLLVRLRDDGRAQAEKLFGPEHFAFKASALLAVGLILFFTFADGDYRVAADTHIEGRVQRVVAAPQDGFIAAAPARAGDLLREGGVMAQLDERDLVLERTKWISQREQYLKQYREALAKADRAEVAVLKAQLGQAEAELALTEEKLSRVRITAPFDGVVVSGDLSQKLGAPVARGDTLYEIAPLDAYRVILEVDERDMKDIRPGQPGQLVLTGESGVRLALRVEKITPVSESRDGRNYFRVEAKLDTAPAFLRPGMKGVGKIEIGRRRLFWIWTHGLFDWARLALWSYWP